MSVQHLQSTQTVKLTITEYQCCYDSPHFCFNSFIVTDFGFEPSLAYKPNFAVGGFKSPTYLGSAGSLAGCHL